MLSRSRSTVALVAAAALPSLPALAAPAKDVVLVHGALADGSGRRQDCAILTRDGLHGTVVQQPMTSLDDDGAATKRVLAAQDGPTVLTEIPSSHVAFISHPEETARFIEAAAQSGVA